ncbi:ABC transporter permease [Stetteria hydrogenophila]
MALAGARTWRELARSVRRFFSEYKRSKIGMTGLILLLLFVAAVVAYPVIGEPEIVNNWLRNPQYFDGVYPKRVPPCWVSKFTGKSYSTRQVVNGDELIQAEEWGSAKVLDPVTGEAREVPKYTYRVEFEFIVDGDVPPREVTLEFDRIAYNVTLYAPNLDPYRSLVRSFLSTGYDLNTVALMLCPEKAGGQVTVDEIAYCLYLKDLEEKLRENLTLSDLVKAGLMKRMPLNVTKLYVYRPDGLVLKFITPQRPVSILEAFGTNPFSYNLTRGGTAGQGAGGAGTTGVKRVKLVEGLLSRKITVTVNGEPVSKLIASGAVEELFNVTITDASQIDLRSLVFGENLTAVVLEKKANVPALKGKYRLVLEISGANVTEASFHVSRAISTGACYGLLGTDNMGRDIWQGVLYGVRWALIIGLLTSVISVFLGAVYGVISGYYGGLVDEVMLRIAQIIYSLPVLPLLILLSYVIKPSIWTLILILVLFSWPGVAFVTRSMALQIKESVYVEAARALGASDRRIIMLYVFPQILPYLFASIALSVPGAILAEAGLSFLGLGDPYTLTWGKILYDAQNASAVLNGMWWWVVPPGLAIALVGMTFVFIGNAIDAILNPKLKR